MQTIPVVNCPDFKCVKKRFAEIKSIGSSWAHIDITDGKFTAVKTWNNPQELITNYQLLISNFKFEVHLMIENPLASIEDWLKAGAKRIIVHFEAIRGSDNVFNALLDKCSAYDVELMLAINPETPAEDLMPYLDLVLFVQILAVKPGPAGQEFNEKVLEKIEFIRERNPDITIEVDGGINLETARLVKAAGADIVAAATYIFNNSNPQRAYEELLRV
mgnify:CR=1 FL=1